MLTEKQQEIVDSLVSEFTKMNAPVNTGKKGLLDWHEIYSEIDAWEKTKVEINLKNEAFIKNAELEMERISEMLNNEFHEYFYIHHPANNDIKYGWTWYIVPFGNTWNDKIMSINMVYHKVQVNNPSNTTHIYSLESLHFISSLNKYVYFTSIEKIFKERSVIDKFKSHLNK